MNPERCLWIVLAAGHLFVVLCGACYYLPERSSAPVAPPFRWYATMSGADTSFGFFAPEVGTTHRARFLLHDDKGDTWWDIFDDTISPEVWLRLTGIVETAFMNAKAEAEPEWRQRLVSSWAAAMFVRHPRAVKLTVVVEAYNVPSMADYRGGARPSWQVVYQAEARRHASAENVRLEQ